MNIVQFDVRQTTIMAILVLYLGKYLTHKTRWLQTFNIPEAVSGGVLASLLFGLLYGVLQLQIDFNLYVRDALLITFFTTIGLSAKLETLRKGGKPLLLLLAMVVIFLWLQNLLGMVTAATLGLNPLVGVLAGSVSLLGGHGTTIAWAPIFVEQHSIVNALEIGIACATFGLVLGGVIGGPIAQWLISRYDLKTSEPYTDITVGIKQDQQLVKIDYNTMLYSLLVLGVTIGLGFQISTVINALGLKLPDFVACLLAGIILTNTVPSMFRRVPWPVDTPALALIADLSLGLFLAMSLMSLQLWTLVGLAGPIFILLGLQSVLSIVYTIWVVFPIMGRTYDAAVIAAGYPGLTLGATPTAIANMSAVTAHFGASPQAFIILPLVGAFFTDIANAFTIQGMINLLN